MIKESYNIAQPWINTPIDFEKLEVLQTKITCIFSDNDYFVSLDQEQRFKELLNAKTLIVKGKGHISADDGIKELDEISISSISHYITLDVNQYTELESLAVTSKYLAVEIISQPTNTNICWSIAITSIVNYIYNGSWNYQDIVNMFTNGLIEVYILNK